MLQKHPVPEANQAMLKPHRTQIGLGLLILLAIAIVIIFSDAIATWLSHWAFIQVLEAFSQLGVLIAVAAFLLEIPKREERAKAEKQRLHFEYWQVIDAAAAAGTATSYARKIALENLAKDGVPLRNIDAPKAELRRINLAGADLTGSDLGEADLTGAILDGADLSKAYLYRARLHGASLWAAQLNHADFREALYDDQTLFPEGFEAAKAGAYLIAPQTVLPNIQLPKAILWGVNLQGANLQNANFSDARFHGACLQKANLRGANLHGAKFRHADLTETNLTEANLCQANFWQATGLTVEQVQAAQHWDEATYSPEFCRQLGLAAVGGTDE